MKRWSACVLSAAVLMMLLCAGLVYIVDPFEIYRKAAWYSPMIAYDTQVYSNAGIAKNYDYDSVIVGTSMMENAHPTLCDALFGGRFIKLVTSSGTACNQAILLNTALQKHELNRVIYGLDMFSFMFDADAVAQTFFPFYLYDENPLNDVRYLLNRDVLLERLPELYKLNRFEHTPNDEDERDALYAWQLGKGAYRHENALAQIQFDAPVRKMDDADAYAKNVKANLQKNVIPFLEQLPNTEFVFYFPPYCVLEWYSMYQRGYLDATIWIKEMLTQTLLQYPNVKLYDYQGKTEWILNLDLYMDRQHHSPEVNDAIMRSIAQDEARVYDLQDIRGTDDALRAWVSDIVEHGASAPVLLPYTQPEEDK